MKNKTTTSIQILLLCALLGGGCSSVQETNKVDVNQPEILMQILLVEVDSIKVEMTMSNDGIRGI